MCLCLLLCVKKGREREKENVDREEEEREKNCELPKKFFNPESFLTLLVIVQLSCSKRRICSEGVVVRPFNENKLL